MHFLITDIKFDCSLDDSDWTIKDQLETEEMLPHSYIGSTWEADSEEDLLEEISCASGWLISELDYKIVLRQLVSTTGQLPDQLARCHTRGRDPSDPVLIIGA